MSILNTRKVSGVTAAAILIAGVAAAFFIATISERAVASPGDMQIFTMDTQRVMEAHPAFLEAVEEYQQMIEEFQGRLEEAGEEEQMFLQQIMQQQLQQQGAELQQRAFDRMQEDVRKFAEEKGYGYVIDSNVMIVGGTEITDEVLESIGVEAAEPDMPDLPELPALP